jgi:6-phosphogluconate dehydrogenase
MVSLAYFDAIAARLPANLTQPSELLRVPHYERMDEKGVFHTQWG